MARVIKLVKGVRNHWKKSLVAAAAISYGVSYGIERYEIHQLMKRYCIEASLYGDVPQPAQQRFTKVLVILNPVADKRSGAKTFDEYCAPILHLAGIAIDVVKTDSEGHARRYIEELESLPEAILVAGGDGTLSEAITGLMRRQNKNDSFPIIGVLPVGRTNQIAANFFNYSSNSNLQQVQGIADATISVVRGKTDRKDIMQIEVLPTESDESAEPKKPVFAVGRLQWGAYRDAFEKRDSYWYVGPLRDYAAFLFNAFNDSITWNCTAKLFYTDPCLGCSNCYVKPHLVEKQSPRRWWSSFIPSFRLGSTNHRQTADYSKIVNKHCSKVTEIAVQPSEILLITQNGEETGKSDTDTNPIPQLSVKLGNGDRGFEFITESWRRLRSNHFQPMIEYPVRTVEIHPEHVSTEQRETFFSIDNEAYEVKPIRVTLLPKAINFYVL